MRWLSLRGWHWWLQWWADRLWQWEDLGISGAWESSALGGENRKHHELLFKVIYTLCVSESWVFIHEFYTSMVLFLNRNVILTTRYYRWLLWNYFSQPPALLHFLDNPNRLPRSDWDASLGRKGLGNPVTYWRGVVLRLILFFFITVFRFCPPKLGDVRNFYRHVPIRCTTAGDTPMFERFSLFGLLRVCLVPTKTNPIKGSCKRFCLWVLHFLHFLGMMGNHEGVKLIRFSAKK